MNNIEPHRCELYGNMWMSARYKCSETKRKVLHVLQRFTEKMVKHTEVKVKEDLWSDESQMFIEKY